MCRSGCPTQDHRTWGECARAARLQIDGHSMRVDIRTDRHHVGVLDRYAALRKAGIQPASTSEPDVRRAEVDGGIPQIVQQWSGGGAWPTQGQ